MPTYAERDKRSVLVVDDEPDVRLLFATVLGEAGFHVDATSDGRQALVQCERRDPEVIVVDLVMPVMDGAAFIREYRARPSASARIVVVSAMLGADRVANQLQCDAVLRKPLDIDDLVGTVLVLAALPPWSLGETGSGDRLTAGGTARRAAPRPRQTA